MSSATTQKSKATAPAKGPAKKAGSKTTPKDDTPKDDTSKGGSGEDKPKRKQNRRARTYIIERQTSVIAHDPAASEILAGVRESVTEAEIKKLIEANTRSDWEQVATVKDMVSGDKWIAENAEDGVSYRVSVVTDPIAYEVETVQRRVPKL